MNSTLSFSIIYYYNNVANGIDVYAIGCELSEYDAEKICEMVNGQKDNTIIVSSCAVTESAKWASEELVKKLRFLYPSKQIYITGCGVTYDESVFKHYGVCVPNLTKFECKPYCVNDRPNINFKHNILTPNLGMIKIQDGCAHQCSYCIIPKLRNKPTSTPYSQIAAEVQRILDEGKTQLQLVGTEVCTYYSDGLRLADLLEHIINDFPAITNISFNALDPASPNIEQVIDVMCSTNKIDPCLCLSLQSGCDRVLTMMTRQHRVNRIRKLVEYGQGKVSFFWHLIVGFPGETDEMFEETVELVRELKPIGLAINPYSDRAGTLASMMPNHVAEDVIRARCKKLEEVLNQVKTKYEILPPLQYDPAQSSVCVDLYTNAGLKVANDMLTHRQRTIVYQYDQSKDQRQLELNIKFLEFKYHPLFMMQIVLTPVNLDSLLSGQMSTQIARTVYNSGIELIPADSMDPAKIKELLISIYNNTGTIASIYNQWMSGVYNLDMVVTDLLETLYNA